ncbi:MAG: DUF447 family protein [Methanosarcinaceae archaeon]|nr:DUF447 family protein [Methanosarcinaceae archaeon]
MKENFKISDDLKQKLKSHGILEGISETIVTSGRKIPNAAPIGIILKYDRLFIRLFSGSKTYENLSKEDYFAANITNDALLFVKSAFSDIADSEFDYVSSKNITEIKTECEDYFQIPVISKSDSFVIFKCMNRTYSSNLMFIDIKPIYFKINNNAQINFVNRGFNSVIDATVHLTRYKITHDLKYIDLIRYHQGIIQRCGRPEDKEALLFLKKKKVEFSLENSNAAELLKKS